MEIKKLIKVIGYTLLIIGLFIGAIFCFIQFDTAAQAAKVALIDPIKAAGLHLASGIICLFGSIALTCKTISLCLKDK